MIHVCFGVYDKDGRYSKFTGTAITSVFENTSSKVTVHILHDNTMTQDNHDKFVYLAGQYGQQIKFYNVEKLCAKKITHIIEMIPAIKNARTTIGTLFSLLTPDVIPLDVDKILYLDSDIIVNMDVKDFLDIDIKDKPLAAATEFDNGSDTQGWLPMCRDGFVKDEDYFNAGVLFLNLKILRNENETILNSIKFRASHPDYNQFDQDIWNYSFSENYLKISTDFNCFVRNERKHNQLIGKKLYHFLGGDLKQGVMFDMNESFNQLYFKYFIKTPWFNAETLGHIYEGVREGVSKIQQELLARMRFISKVFSGKQRAFFLQPRNIDMLKNIFGIEEDEEIISAINDNSVNQLIDSMKNSDGKKIYIIVTENLPSVHAELTRAGFIEGKDFISGGIFFAEVGGIHTNSYQLIKKM